MFASKPARPSGSAALKTRPSLAERRSARAPKNPRVYQADKSGVRSSSGSARSWGGKTTAGVQQHNNSFSKTNFNWVNAILLLVGVIVLTSAVWGGAWLLQQLRPWPNPTTILFVPPQKSSDSQASQFSAVWLWYYPAQQRARVVYFQPDFTLPVAGGYGQYPLSSIWPLLKLDHRSAQYIGSAAGLGLGTPLTQVIPTIPSQVLNTPKEWEEFLWQVGREGGVAGLPFLEAWQLGQNLGEISLANWEVKTEMTMEAWPLARRGLPSVVELGECSVAVVNTTTNSGLASRLGRVWEDSGVRVVKTADTLPTQAKTTLMTDGAENCQAALTVVNQTLPEPPSTKTDSELTNQYRANIVVMVGEDIAKFWPL